MEEQRLLNIQNSKSGCFNPKYFKISIFFLITILISLQTVTLVYLIVLGNLAEKLELNTLNISNANLYINKTELIIDYICKNYIKC